MNPQHFTFPPPPPPPPAFQNYPANTHNGGNQSGYEGNRSRGDWGHRGHYRDSNRPNSRGGGNFRSTHTRSASSGYPLGSNGVPFQTNTGYAAQGSGQGGSDYALPNYPPVQLPQYPANLGQDYGSSPSALPPGTALSRSHQSAFPTNIQNTTHQRSGQQQYDTHRFDSPTPNNQPGPNLPPNQARFKSKYIANSSQPVLMGPPIRLGFDEQREVRQIQQYSHPPVVNGPNPYYNGAYNSSGLPYPESPSIDDQVPRNGSANPFPGNRGGQKRRYGDAFGRSRSKNPRGQVAPAVPSFGAPLPLPVKPPVSLDNPKKSKKKKRKHNQLGLTPRAAEHESSEGEDDADEESKLAAAVAGTGQAKLLQFEYKGRTSTLQTPSDIAAWIEERKKRFPTRARIAEMAELKRQRQEAHKAASIERREAQERQRAEATQRQKEKTEADREQRQREKKPVDSEEAAAKAKRKVEKLRKQLEKEERRAAKAEAEASNNKCKADAEGHLKNGGPSESAEARDTNSIFADPEQPLTKSTDATHVKVEPNPETKQICNEVEIHEFALGTSQEKVQELVNTVPDPLTPTSQPPAIDEDPYTSSSALNEKASRSETTLPKGMNCTEGDEPLVSTIAKTSPDSSISMSDSISDISSTDSEDITSSSGSSSSDSISEDDGPDQTSSRRNGPERVPPPPRAKSKQICRDFLKNGRCKRGDSCRFLHELPEKGSQSKAKKEPKGAEGKTERVGLYQRLVEQEKEKEDHEILKSIIHLGESGHLYQATSLDGLN